MLISFVIAQLTLIDELRSNSAYIIHDYIVITHIIRPTFISAFGSIKLPIVIGLPLLIVSLVTYAKRVK